MRTIIVKVSAAIFVGAVTASQEYRVLMEGCEVMTSSWYQRLVVVVAFGVLYSLVAYGLQAVALRSAIVPKSWLQTGLTLILAFTFGGIALASAPLVAAATNLTDVASSPTGIAVTQLASYPNKAGAILGSFVFLLVCMSAQEFKFRRQKQLAYPSEA